MQLLYLFISLVLFIHPSIRLHMFACSQNRMQKNTEQQKNPKLCLQVHITQEVYRRHTFTEM